MKKYDRKELIKKLKPFHKKIQKIQSNYYDAIDNLEKEMQHKIGIEDLEIFWCDGTIVGIGNYSRTLKLIDMYELRQ